MLQERVERRRGRRVKMEALLFLRRDDAKALKAVNDHITKDISLVGVYFESEAPLLAVNDVVVASVSIPEAQRKEFPFARIAGRSRVVRVEELPTPPEERPQRFGVAIEFGDDVTALSAIPARG